MSLEEIRNDPKTSLQSNGVWLEIDAAQQVKIVHSPLALNSIDSQAASQAVKAALGLRSGVFHGVAITGGITRAIYSVGAENADLLVAHSLCSAWASLAITTPAANKAACSDPRLGSDTHVAYSIYYGEEPYAHGKAEIAAETVTLVLPTGAPAGQYTVYINRLQQDHASGKTVLTVGG